MKTKRTEPRMPRSQTSAPVKPPHTTEEVYPHGDADGGTPRQAGDEDAVRGDRMPKGADEPGAGL